MTLEEFKNKVFNLRHETMQKIDEIRKSFSDSFPLKKGDLIQNKTRNTYRRGCVNCPFV